MINAYLFANGMVMSFDVSTGDQVPELQGPRAHAEPLLRERDDVTYIGFTGEPLTYVFADAAPPEPKT